VHNARAIDLFAGCGGLTAGLRRAGFNVVCAVEMDELAAETYESNHPEVHLLPYDIARIQPEQILRTAGSIDLVAGCPPCQGFSRVRRRNRVQAAPDERNDLIAEFLRIVEALQPASVFLENVPGIEDDQRFHSFLARLESLGYVVESDTLDLSRFGIPQRRSRVVVLAGRGFRIKLPRASGKRLNVRDAIGELPRPSKSGNQLHDWVTMHQPRTLERIRAVPKNGGSRRSWPDELRLKCHGGCDGFKDVYGRMAWDEPAPTITGGCINASKGRFLHPTQNRAITLFEAALLQSFGPDYSFSLRRGRYPAAEMIGNALPPKFAERVGRCILRELERHCDG
jgi:DNA (cytosine-5)-methyltransferase 1